MEKGDTPDVDRLLFREKTRSGWGNSSVLRIGRASKGIDLF